MVSHDSPAKVSDSSNVRFTRVPLSDKVPEDINRDNVENEKGEWDFFTEEPVDVQERSRDQLCGVGSWRPGWLQKFASHRAYALSYVIIGVVQGMIYSYFNGVITTVEKAFAVPSSMMGFVLSGNDISQILCGVLVTYIAGRGSRPFWLAIGMLVTAGSLFLYASAQLFYDPEVHEVSRTNTFLNETGHHVMCNAHEGVLLGDGAAEPSTCTTKQSSIPALVIFFIGQFISGIGSTAMFTLGFTYMDDGVKRSAFPLYMTITGALRSFGPALGYLLASSCLKTYIEPTKTTEYTQRDVRWLGAWWLGFLVIGTLQIIITFPVLLFPKELPKAKKPSYTPIPRKEPEPKKEETTNKTLTEIKGTIERMTKNPIIVFQLLSTGPVILGMIGFSIFLPKYMEANFGKTAAQATMITGTSSMLMMMLGSIFGGLFVWKFQPSAFKITIWGGISDLLYAIGILTIMTFACDSVDFVGASFENGALEVTSSCSQSCGCDTKFDPICIENQNYLSPCLAGCETYRTENTTIFLNCACTTTSSLLNTSSALTVTHPQGTVGYCPGSRGNCAFFYPYVMVLSSVKLIASSTRVGGMLVLLRSVDKRDKAVGMAMWGTVASLLGFIPGPIIYGAIVDSTCLLWNQKPCGGKGNCWLYNLDNLRYWFHGITAISFFFAAFCDFLTSLFCHELDLYNESSGRVLTYKEGFRRQKSSKPNYLRSQSRYSISSMRLRSYDTPPS